MSHGSPVLEDGTQRYASEERAAIITQVLVNGQRPRADDPAPHEDAEGLSVSLVVFNPEGFHFNHNIAYCAQRSPGTWHWTPLA